MSRYKITIEYDGTNYSGWQKQSGAVSIQEKIEQAIYKFSNEEAMVYGSGRTDAGVHAKGQVAHFDLVKNWDTHNVICAINFYIRNDGIVIKDCEQVVDDFHARFWALKRVYKYVILNRKTPPALEANRVWYVRSDLDVEKMRDATKLLIGTHDFSSFRSAACQAKSPIKTLDSIDIQSFEEKIVITVMAKSFLHNMVRNLAGALCLIGSGKWSNDDLLKFLNAKNSKGHKYTAPSAGLYLEEVIF